MAASRIIRPVAALIAALTFSATTSAFAQKPEAETPALTLMTIDTCATASIVPEEADDQRAYDNAITAFATSSFPALRVYAPRMEEAMSHAPDCYPLIEQRGDNIIIRAMDTNEYVALSVAAAATASTTQNRNIAIAQARNTYVNIALLLGSFANENHEFERAIAWLDRGLALQPRNQYLIMERVSALLALERHAEAYTAIETALNDPQMALTLDRARYQRNAGVVLIDLNRLDEAEAALNESIRLQPNNPGARAELAYIAQLRQGGPQRHTTITAPNAPTPQTQ